MGGRYDEAVYTIRERGVSLFGVRRATALHKASDCPEDNGHTETVEELLKAKADVDKAQSETGCALSAFHGKYGSLVAFVAPCVICPAGFPRGMEMGRGGPPASSKGEPLEGGRSRFKRRGTLIAKGKLGCVPSPLWTLVTY